MDRRTWLVSSLCLIAARPPAQAQSPQKVFRVAILARSSTDGPAVGLWKAFTDGLSELAAKGRLPSMAVFREYADAGGLAAYGPSFLYNYRRAAWYVDRILRGAKPGDLPVEQPKTFELATNLKSARALGLTIPQSVLGRADAVIE